MPHISGGGLFPMSDLPFTLDQLRILKAITAEGSFKRAADSLYVANKDPLSLFIPAFAPIPVMGFVNR
jgi:hypothetical protein